MTTLIATADLHLTANPRDEYRWGVFRLLRELAEGARDPRVAILGDLTDAKDRHPARLVNRVVSEVARLAEVARVYVLAGNHDYVERSECFFSFLNHLHNVRFVHTRPRSVRWGNHRVLLAPHMPSDALDELATMLQRKNPVSGEPETYSLVLMHQTVSGSVASNGARLDGLPPSLFGGHGVVLSGDVHVPQRVGPVEYVGSPYPVRFGDKAECRVVVLRLRAGGRKSAIKSVKTAHLFPARTIIRVGGVRAAKDAIKRLKRGDQARVEIKVPPGKAVTEKDVASLRRLADARGVEVVSLSVAREVAERPQQQDEGRVPRAPADRKTLLEDFCRRKRLRPRVAALGKELLEEATDGA